MEDLPQRLNFMEIKKALENCDLALENLLKLVGIETTPAEEISPMTLEIPADIAERAGRAVSVALACYGTRERAIAAIDYFLAVATANPALTLGTPLAQILNPRTASILHAEAVRTLEHLLQFSPTTLAQVENIGPKTAAYIQLVLKSLGLSLRENLG